MGPFKWSRRIFGMDGQQERDIDATVGIGASFTTLSPGLLWELSIGSTGKRRFLLA